MVDKCAFEQPQEPSNGLKNTCGLNLVELHNKAKDSIVRVASPEGGIGSGFLISNGKETLVVTDDHNLDENSKELMIQHRGQKYHGSAILQENKLDIAILKLDQRLANPPKTFLLPDLELPAPNSGVATIGFPGGLKTARVTPGILNGQDRFYEDMTIVNSTQACDFGNSGSIQISANGRWWGIQQAVGPHYNCVSLGAQDIVTLIRRLPGWENYAKDK